MPTVHPTVHPTVQTGRDRGTYHQNVVDALQRERERERVRGEKTIKRSQTFLYDVRFVGERRPRRDASEGRSVRHVGTSRTIFRC